MADNSTPVVAPTMSTPRPTYDDIAVTGRPWLDGVLYARGSKRTRSSIWIRIGHIPHLLLPDVEREMDHAGFRVNYEVIPHAITRKDELYLVGESVDVACDQMGPFQTRRLPTQAPKEFLLGYFFIACEARVHVGLVRDHAPAITHLAVAPWAEQTELERVRQELLAMGLSSAVRRRRSICISPEDAAKTPPFDRILAAAQQETQWAHAAAQAVPIAENTDERSLRLQALLATMYIRRLAAARHLGEIPLQFARRKPLRRFSAVSPAVMEEVKRDCEALAQSPRGPVAREAMRQLAQRYESVLRTYFALSWDFKALHRMAKDASRGTLPDTHDARLEKRELRRRRKALQEVLDLKLTKRLLLERRGPAIAPPAAQAITLAVRECAREVYGRLAGFHFAPPIPRLPDLFLRRCASCSGAAVLSFGTTCGACGIALCDTCERRSGRPTTTRPVLCQSHRAADAQAALANTPAAPTTPSLPSSLDARKSLLGPTASSASLQDDR